MKKKRELKLFKVRQNKTGRLLQFLLLMLIAIGVRYYLSPIFADLFFVGLLVLYFFSDEEPFWLAVMLALSDGFFSFFGYFEVNLTAIPGMPEIEVSQFYILLALVKAWNRPAEDRLFFKPFLVVLFIYLIFLIVQGYTMGISLALNIQFRSIRNILPLTLFFSIPRLFREEKDYVEFFRYCFVIAIMVLVAQVFTLTFRQSPIAYFGALDEGPAIIMAGDTYRGLYSVAALLISLFGALYFLARKDSAFKTSYLYFIVIADFLSVFLSATRGWVVCFGMATFLFFVFVLRFDIVQLTKISIAVVALFFLSSFSPFLQKQVDNSVKRLLTLESLAKGDMTADGTLIRVSQRGPKIMKMWRESPLTGWGYSDYYYANEDHHVGNQNLLFHSGILGALLMAAFMFYFSFKIFYRSLLLSDDNKYKKALLVFPIFLFSWFLLHSTSFQSFEYGTAPLWAIIQAVFFSFGGLVYSLAAKTEAG